MTLYIDTHYSELVLALINNEKVINKKVLESNKHSVNTITLLKSLLDDNKISIDDIEEIIVINGPGSFTGVRIGIVIAKTIGYAKNIKIKAISYLQALSLNYDMSVILGIKDKNGVFIGEFNKEHELVSDYIYLSNKEVLESNKEIIYDNNVNIASVVKFLKNKDSINPHLLKPLYVKRIEVQNA